MAPQASPRWLYASLIGILTPTATALYTRTPGLEQLNFTLEGRLEKSLPLAAPCFEDTNSAACASVREGLNSSWTRTSQYPGFRFIQDEACASNERNQCLLDPITLDPLGETCEQGILSPHYVEIESPSDAQAIFDYARQSGGRLSIKNSGVDYNTRSSLQDSLAIWTRGLRHSSFEESFIPEGCPADTEPFPVLTFGAGISCDEAYTIAHGYGVTHFCGTVNAIGASGGWLLNGGHGVLSGSHGLGADRVVQFTIVTPDGKIRIVNKCSNPELFWALRGAGGGAFGVIIDSTHPSEPEKSLTGASLQFQGTTESQRAFTTIMTENMHSWALQGWGGPSSPSFSMLVNDKVSVDDAKKALAPALDFVRAQNGSIDVRTYKNFYQYYTENMNGSLAAPMTISGAIVTTTRIVPEDHFLDAEARERMVNAIMDTQAAGLPTSFLTTMPLLYGRNNPEPNTSLHPAWYKSVWIVASSVQWTAASSIKERKQLVSMLKNTTSTWKKVIPDGCTYANEADPWDDNWAYEFWGDNYKSLLQIKASVDPDNLLNCRHCVGWEESLPGYECMSGLDV
ncbi:hypothetical protein LT330_007009 [Penicillium expansum]|uniref:FAD linked oxidase, N-terminal n=1 Tax=Penicillium expansum TaxID=27334 RepID=A0A0A2KK13_PENEN|nr:FAD linked oxidase, N-terminal [Penicillium expansum]KAK4868287.1 hypothetical protein LT330_007009 [Penicillium expansum]KGO48674.1 FAD linked oxidase, N-terminal [Penicillium expansum]KGO57211.1 FAD linked oxidase, N-terminal [Penicillium expansum]KGO67318.1 FAD linked oxidase, N-terminal [Penicillium expansum]